MSEDNDIHEWLSYAQDVPSTKKDYLQEHVISHTREPWKHFKLLVKREVSKAKFSLLIAAIIIGNGLIQMFIIGKMHHAFTIFFIILGCVIGGILDSILDSSDGDKHEELRELNNKYTEGNGLPDDINDMTEDEIYYLKVFAKMLPTWKVATRTVKELGLKNYEILISPSYDDGFTAASVNLSGDKNTIIIYPNLSEHMDQSIRGVIAHEFGHYKYKQHNPVLKTLSSLDASVYAFVGIGILSPVMPHMNPLLFGGVFMVLHVFGRLTILRLSWKEEYAADKIAAEETGGLGLAMHLATDPSGLNCTSRYLENQESWLHKIANTFTTHPPSHKRAERLVNMWNERDLLDIWGIDQDEQVEPV